MLKPLGDRLLIQRDEAEKETGGGILLPEKSQDKPHTGTVLAVGPGKTEPITGVQTGDRVMFKAWAGEHVDEKVAGVPNAIIINKDDLWGVISGTDASATSKPSMGDDQMKRLFAHRNG